MLLLTVEAGPPDDDAEDQGVSFSVVGNIAFLCGENWADNVVIITRNMIAVMIKIGHRQRLSTTMAFIDRC
jgi:hypothetical protein